MYELYIQQKIFKITDHYDVWDANRNPIYHVDQDFRLIGNTVHLSRLDGSPVFTINREVLTFMPRFRLDFASGKSALVKQNFTFFKKDIDIISDDYLLKLQGNFWDMDFSVYNNGIEVGNIRKEIFAWGDTYVIQVINPEFEEELIALLIVVDNLKDQDNNN